MASSTSNILILLFLLSALSFSRTWALNSSSSSSTTSQEFSYIKSICKTTPYSDICLDTLELAIKDIANDSSPNNTAYYIVFTLKTAINASEKLSIVLSEAKDPNNIIKKQRGAIQDCTELHQITLSSLQRSVSRINDAPLNEGKVADARVYLSAALTNKITCLESLDSASGPLKPALLNSINDTYKHVSNSLSILSSQNNSQDGLNNRHLMDVDVPTWISKKLNSRTQILDRIYLHSMVLTVAADGTGNFTTITDAINFAPKNSNDQTRIYVKQGVYEENVVIPSYKPNIFILGDGTDATIITGNRSKVDGWTTFSSATLAVSGEDFWARDIKIENKAGAEKQGVSLRVNADFVAFYKCSIIGYENTLHVHSFRQFYRECDIQGTIDFIFGNAVAVFQSCDIVTRMPMAGQLTVITAQSRDSSDENTGISIQNCSIVAANDFHSNSISVKSYLGRPGGAYSQTVYLESNIGDFIDPAGWMQLSIDGDGDDQRLDTLYFGEYGNYGPGSSTDDRVTWPGYHVMSIIDALNFTVLEFINGADWLGFTPFPCDYSVKT
ncbi:hypothetical protein ACB098_07G014700 [Castanea mollissima]